MVLLRPKPHHLLKDVPGSSTTNFQHSEEEIIREQFESQVLDACKLSMVVDLTDVLSNIKSRKKLGYGEIYQIYKKHFVLTKNGKLCHTLVTKECSTYKLYFKINWLEDCVVTATTQVIYFQRTVTSYGSNSERSPRNRL